MAVVSVKMSMVDYGVLFSINLLSSSAFMIMIIIMIIIIIISYYYYRATATTFWADAAICECLKLRPVRS